MTSLFVGFLFAIGAGGWVYAKVQQNAGGANPKNALIAAVITGCVGFIVIWTLFHSLFHK